MATKKITLETPMLKIKFGGYATEYILPWETGVQILNLMRDAINVQSLYADGKSTWHRRKGEELQAEGFSPESQAQVLMSGEPSCA